MHNTIKEENQVSPSFLFFLVHSTQIGVGILGFQRYIIKGAGYEAWISIILAAISICILLAMIFNILTRENSDIIDIHRLYFGRYLGGALTLAASIYYFIFALTIYRTYVEILQIWMFPQLETWVVSLVYLPIIYYTVSGGFRVITGIAFFGIMLPLPLVFALLYPLKYGHLNNLFPLFDHTIWEFLISTKMMTFENLGFESVLFFYPFIKNGATSQKWGQYGVLFSTFLYLCTALVSFAYFSQGQLGHTIWPTLTMAKIIEIPFLQRFEYILISLWLLVVLPTIAVSVWCTIRGFSKTFNKPPTIFLILVLIALLGFSIFFDDRETIDQLNTRLSMTGFYFIYGYIPFLFLYSLIRAKIKQKKAQKEEREPTLS